MTTIASTTTTTKRQRNSFSAREKSHTHLNELENQINTFIFWHSLLYSSNVFTSTFSNPRIPDLPSLAPSLPRRRHLIPFFIFSIQLFAAAVESVFKIYIIADTVDFWVSLNVACYFPCALQIQPFNSIFWNREYENWNVISSESKEQIL